MTSPASVGCSEQLRLFFGLPLPPATIEALVRWQRAALEGARGVRIVPSAHLHVTLAFLGDRPVEEVPLLGRALHAAAAGLEWPVLGPLRYRETDRVAMVVLTDEEGRAGLLQARLSQALERLDVYRSERRPWLPHVTVGRFRTRPRLRPALPELEPFSPSEAALYSSLLRPSGAQYEIIEAVSLGG